MANNFVFIVRLIIATAFVALGIAVWYFGDKTILSYYQKLAFSILLIAYGLFRVYRAIKRSDDIFVDKK